MLKRFVTSIACFALLLSMSLVSLANEKDNVGVINAFLKSLDGNKQVDDAKKADIKTLVEELRDDEYSRTAAITEGLTMVYPEFAAALEKLGADDVSSAVGDLKKLADSKDEYLAAEASFYLARAMMFDQAFEESLPILEKVVKDFDGKTVQAGSALYFKGIAEANLLENKKAIKSLAEFVKEYPSAPERLRISAVRQVEILKSIEAGSLMDVYQRMDFSRRRLEIENTNQATQKQQDKIISLLDKMIKKAEDQESKSCSSCKKPGEGDKPGDKPSEGKGEGKGKGKSQNGAGSQNPDGSVRRTFGTGPASAWSKLRERDREAAFNSIKEKYPARYQKMVEQYFKNFQDVTNK